MNEVLFSWMSLPFAIPFATALLFVGVDMAVGGVGFGIDADIDVDVDIDIDIDADVDADGEVGIGVLGWLGVGKLPLSLLVEMMGLAFGAVGLVSLATLAFVLPPWAALAGAVGAGIGAAPVVTHFMGAIVLRLVPGDETTSIRAHTLVGEIGVAASRIGAHAGQVRIEADGSPMFLNVRCEDTVARGTSVRVVTYDARTNLFTVTPTQEV